MYVSVLCLMFLSCSTRRQTLHHGGAPAAPPRGRGDAELLERRSVAARPQAESSSHAAGGLDADRWPDGVN